MKITTITKSIAAAALLSGSATVLLAQNADPACPFGYEPGYGRSLSLEQRAEHREAIQYYVAELRQKQANGATTAEEQALLEQVEQRGGMCITGTPRGRGEGKGQRGGNGAGQGRRQGLRDGTGPRNVDGMCITGTPRGRGEGKGQRRGNGAGQGRRQGLRDGTGPRSVDGTCADGNSPQRRGRQ